LSFPTYTTGSSQRKKKRQKRFAAQSPLIAPPPSDWMDLYDSVWMLPKELAGSL